MEPPPRRAPARILLPFRVFRLVRCLCDIHQGHNSFPPESAGNGVCAGCVRTDEVFSGALLVDERDVTGSDALDDIPLAILGPNSFVRYGHGFGDQTRPMCCEPEVHPNYKLCSQNSACAGEGSADLSLHVEFVSDQP